MIKLKQIREDKDIKQEILAKELGVTQTTISNWESGAREPDIQMLIKISKYFDVTVDYLIGNDMPNKKFASELKQSYENMTKEKMLDIVKKQIDLLLKLEK